MVTYLLREAISIQKPATDLVNDKPALVTERPVVANEKASTHFTWVVYLLSKAAIRWIVYYPRCALALKCLTTSLPWLVSPLDWIIPLLYTIK